MCICICLKLKKKTIKFYLVLTGQSPDLLVKSKTLQTDATLLSFAQEPWPWSHPECGQTHQLPVWYGVCRHWTNTEEDKRDLTFTLTSVHLCFADKTDVLITCLSFPGWAVAPIRSSLSRRHFSILFCLELRYVNVYIYQRTLKGSHIMIM